MVGRWEGCFWVLQIRVHLLECALGLREKVVDYTLAEFALVLVVVHLQDLPTAVSVTLLSHHMSQACLYLLEGGRINQIRVRKPSRRAIFGLCNHRTISTHAVRRLRRLGRRG